MTTAEATSAGSTSTAATDTTVTPSESIVDSATSRHAMTSDPTSSGLTTVPQTSVTGSSSPEVRCCCRCCSPSVPTCAVCERDSLSDASECANEKRKTSSKSVDRGAPKFEAPAAMKGSQYPERLAYREDFLKLEQLTENLATLPESQKIELGFKHDDLIIDCLYDGSPCSVER